MTKPSIPPPLADARAAARGPAVWPSRPGVAAGYQATVDVNDTAFDPLCPGFEDSCPEKMVRPPPRPPTRGSATTPTGVHRQGLHPRPTRWLRTPADWGYYVHSHGDRYLNGDGKRYSGLPRGLRRLQPVGRLLQGHRGQAPAGAEQPRDHVDLLPRRRGYDDAGRLRDRQGQGDRARVERPRVLRRLRRAGLGLRRVDLRAAVLGRARPAATAWAPPSISRRPRAASTTPSTPTGGAATTGRAAPGRARPAPGARRGDAMQRSRITGRGGRGRSARHRGRWARRARGEPGHRPRLLRRRRALDRAARPRRRRSAGRPRPCRARRPRARVAGRRAHRRGAPPRSLRVARPSTR